MKRILSLLTVLILIVLTVQFSLASPLIFKTVKEIKNNNEGNLAELLVFDTSKYKQVRVGILCTDEKTDSLNDLQIFAVENDDYIFIVGDVFKVSKSFLIEDAPTKIRLAVRKSGTYKIFIWASQ